MIELSCHRCKLNFTLAPRSRKGRKKISCPSCGTLLDIDISALGRSNPGFKVTRALGGGVVLEPEKISGKFRCCQCTRTFFFEKGSGKEQYTKPHCSFCGSPKVAAITPLAMATTGAPPWTKKQLKAVRFIKRNYKALVEMRKYFKAFPEIVRRADFPSVTEDTFLGRGEVLFEDILMSMEKHADFKLDERLKELGLEDDRDLFKVLSSS